MGQSYYAFKELITYLQCFGDICRETAKTTDYTTAGFRELTGTEARRLSVSVVMDVS